MTRINNQYDSINLSQGFPDFDPPKELTDALAKAAHDGPPPIERYRRYVTRSGRPTKR